jgi:hypothetical protein
MGSEIQQPAQADADPQAAEPVRSALGPGPSRSLHSADGVPTQALALAHLIGNRATGRLVAGEPGATWVSGAGSRAGVRRLLARVPTLAARVTAAADKSDWKVVGGLLSTAPMGRLLDAVAEVETTGKLTWISINLPASLKKPSLERILAAIAAVQHAPAEEQMAHRLALGPADERALAKWLDAHPEATPDPDPDPGPITRADGTVFDPPSGVADDRGWSRALLRFLHFGPPAAPGAEACTLDGQPSTLTDVALLVAEQGLFKGNHSLDPSQARTYVDEYFADVTAAAGKAHDIVAKVGQRDAAVIDNLSDLPIGTLLAVLDDVRAAGKIDDLIDLVAPVPPSSRVMAALLSAGGHLGLRWRKAVDDMVPAEQAIVRSFLSDRVVYADTFAPTQIVKKRPGEPDTGKPFTRPPGADETWAATVDDAGWVDAFLRYFKLMRVPFDDDNLWFNEVPHPVDEIIDITVEQALLAGMTGVSADVVKKVIDKNRDTLMKRAPLDPNQIVIQWTFVPVTYHKDLSSGAKNRDQPGNQIQIGYTIKFKNVGAWWSEIDVTGFVQGSFFADPVTKKVDFRDPKLQSFVVGGQAAWVIPLFSNKWQLQTIAQVVAGSARTYDTDSQGNITISPVSLVRPNMAQAAAQVQIVYQPFDNPKLKWLQFYAGAGGSLTQVGKVQTEDGQPFFFGVGGAF